MTPHADHNLRLVQHFERQVLRLTSTGAAPIALLGASDTCRRVHPTLHAPPGVIVGVIDDDPNARGRQWAGLPVIDAEEALQQGIKGVILTHDPSNPGSYERLWAGRGVLREAGVYILACPCPHETMNWDQCLIDQYEHALAASRGIDLLYRHAYPPADPVAWPYLLEPLQARFLPEMTVCEIGTGAGLWTQHLIDRAGSYHAVDYSARLLNEVIEHRFARQMSRLHLHHDTRASLAGVEDGSVDLVFSFDVFVHFKADLVHQFLESIRRVLRPDGVALIHFVTWNETALQIWRREHTPERAGAANVMHYTTMDQLRTSAAALGMAVEQVGEESGWSFLAEFRNAGR